MTLHNLQHKQNKVHDLNWHWVLQIAPCSGLWQCALGQDTSNSHFASHHRSMSNDSPLPTRLLSVAIALEGMEKARHQAEWHNMQVENCKSLRGTTIINHYVVVLNEDCSPSGETTWARRLTFKSQETLPYRTQSPLANQKPYLLSWYPAISSHWPDMAIRYHAHLAEFGYGNT